MLNVTIQNDGKIKIQSECSGLKELKFNVNLLFKAIIDTAADDRHDILLSQSPDESFINAMRDALESAGCICRITNGF